MKDTHLYQRMTSPQAVKVFLHMIKNDNEHVVKELYDNITREASDHPRYPAIQEAYKQRFGA